MASPEPAPAFDVTVQRRGATLVATTYGELDLVSAPLLVAALRSEDDYQRLVIDLREIGFMDSSGLRLLVAEQDRAEQHGYTLQLVRGGVETSRLLRLTRLDEKLPFVDADVLEE
ncbi:MAG TPA: STAS domain-containing protein [Conexibacter sp.]|jgi:anti-anti-sigma factor